MVANLNICLKLYCTWNNLSKVWSDCNKKLEESLQMSLQYQDTMQVCVQTVLWASVIDHLTCFYFFMQTVFTCRVSLSG